MIDQTKKEEYSESYQEKDDLSEESYQFQPKKPRKKKTQTLLPSFEQLGNKLEDQSKDSFNEEFVEKLYSARDKLHKFMSELGPYLEKNLPDVVLKHVNKKSNPHKTLHFTTVKQYTRMRIQKMIKNKRIKKNWTNEDLSILIWVTAKFCQINGIKDVYYGISQQDWDTISAMIPSSTSESCMFKWLSLKKIKREDLQWKKKEQEILMQLAKEKQDQLEDIHWNQIAKKLFFQNSSKSKIYRGGKQCRERWNCFLNPKIKKGLWQKDQDIKLIKMILDGEGQKKWSRLVPHFGGRTQNALKNRYHLLIEKQLKFCQNFEDLNETDLLQKFLQRNYLDTFFPKKVQSEPEEKEEFMIDGNSVKVIKLNETKMQELKERVIENHNDYFVCRLINDGFLIDYSPK